MKRPMQALTASLALCGAAVDAAHAGDDEAKIDLAVLYVGNTGTARAGDFVGFLESRFASVRAADRSGFDPATARGADVVLLDWSQDDLDRARGGFGLDVPSPLGDRDAWATPTVLLGSAGLLIAGPWQTVGSYG